MNIYENHRGVRGKLFLTALIPILTLMGLSYPSYRSLQSISQKVEVLGAQMIPFAEAVGRMRASVNAIPRYVWLSLAYDTDAGLRKQYLGKAREELASLRYEAGTFPALNTSEVVRSKFSESKDLLDRLESLLSHVEPLLIVGRREKDAEVKSFLLVNMAPPALALSNILSDLSRTSEGINAGIVADGRHQTVYAIWFILIFGGIGSIAISIFSYIVSDRLSKTLVRISDDVSNSSQQVSSASGELCNASQALASSSQEQASAIEEASASLQEISGMVENNVRNAESSTQLAEGVMKVAQKGNESMEQMVRSMNEILESNKRIEKLVKVIEEIGEKTELIDEIVFQTKLLSFNASVEAERAGEHGRGFAVVAQEVGNLAQMSGKSSLEISTIVKSSIKDAQEVASDNKEKVQKGSELANATAVYLKDVRDSAKSLLEKANEIVGASKEQSSGIRQISVSVENLNRTTQETAATAEESASAGKDLNSEAEVLQGLVGDLREIVKGSQGRTSPVTTAADPFKKERDNVRRMIPRKSKFGVGTSKGLTRLAAGAEDLGLETDSEVNDGWEKL